MQPAGFQPLRHGAGQAPAHHGELVQGVLEGGDGRLHRCLSTLLHFSKSSTASFELDGSALRVEPAFKQKALRAARATLADLGFPRLGGLLKIHSDIPLGRGMGSSTADCLAAIQAVAAALGRRLSPEIQARLVVDSESASDGIMYPDQAVIFAHREGILLESLGPLPGFEVLGFDSDPDGRGVDTLELKPARYSSREIEAFRSVFMTLRRGVELQDAALVGRAATASAVINQRFLPKPRFDELRAIVDRTGCLGLQVAHSGTVVGLLLDNTAADHDARVGQARRQLAEIGFSTTWRFDTLRPPTEHHRGFHPTRSLRSKLPISKRSKRDPTLFARLAVAEAQSEPTTPRRCNSLPVSTAVSRSRSTPATSAALSASLIVQARSRSNRSGDSL